MFFYTHCHSSERFHFDMLQHDVSEHVTVVIEVLKSER